MPATFWISALVAHDEPVRIHSVKLAHGTRSDVADSLALGVARRIGQGGEVTLMNGRRIAWFEREHTTHGPNDEWLLYQGAGLIDSIDATTAASNGRDALRSAQRTTKLLGSMNPSWLDGDCVLDEQEIVDRFHRSCTGGRVWGARGGGTSEMCGLSSRQRRDILRKAIACAKNTDHSAQKTAFDVTTLCDRGEIKLIFAAPRQPGSKSNSKWKSWIDSVNLRCALGARLVPKEAFRMGFMRLTPATLWMTALGTLVSMLSAVKITDTVSGEFQLESAARCELRAPAAAFVKSIYAGEGDAVSPGSHVLRLAIPDLPTRIATGKAKLREVNAELRLLETGSRQVEIAEQQRIVRQNDSEVELAKAAVEQSRLALQQKLAGLDKQSAQWKAELEFALQAYQRKKGLVGNQAVSKDDFEESVKEVRVCRARLEQIEAEKQMYEEAGTMRAESDLARAEKELAEARAKLALLEAGSRKEDIEAARARREAVTQQLAYLEKLAQQLVLRSHISGVVTTADLDEAVGQYFREGELICTVEDLGVMQARISIGEDDAARVAIGQSLRLKFRALPFQEFHGVIESISPAAAARTSSDGSSPPRERTMIVSCRVVDDQGQLRPGMSGYARVAQGRASLASIAVDRALRFVRTEFWW